MAEPEDRCRLVLIAPAITDDTELEAAVAAAIRGGDVATLIIPQYGLDEASFQKRAERLVPLGQGADVAVIIAGDSRIAGRSGADGLHVSEGLQAAAEAIEKFTPKQIVGVGNVKDRHGALEYGELRPDYVFFGRLDGDIKPEAHGKVLSLAEWWAALVEIPCIAMGGTSIASALEVAETGADFVAMREAVFGHPGGAALAIAEINAMLAEKAPRFGA